MFGQGEWHGQMTCAKVIDGPIIKCSKAPEHFQFNCIGWSVKINSSIVKEVLHLGFSTLSFSPKCNLQAFQPLFSKSPAYLLGGLEFAWPKAGQFHACWTPRLMPLIIVCCRAGTISDWFVHCSLLHCVVREVEGTWVCVWGHYVFSTPTLNDPLKSQSLFIRRRVLLSTEATSKLLL